MWPPAKTITIRTAPMASGAITLAPAPIPVHPIVKIKKNVPMNSAMYLFIDPLFCRSKPLVRSEVLGRRLQNIKRYFKPFGGGTPFAECAHIDHSIRHQVFVDLRHAKADRRIREKCGLCRLPDPATAARGLKYMRH